MELRVIDGQPFIAVRQGKRDVFQTPQKVIADAQQSIAESGRFIGSMRQAEQTAQHRLDAATLVGDSTESIRSEIAAIEDEITGAQRDAADARSVIDQVLSLVDRHSAEAIEQADTARIDAALQPLTTFIKEHS